MKMWKYLEDQALAVINKRKIWKEIRITVEKLIRIRMNVDKLIRTLLRVKWIRMIADDDSSTL